MIFLKQIGRVIYNTNIKDIDIFLSDTLVEISFILVDPFCVLMFMRKHNNFVKLCRQILKLEQECRLTPSQNKFTPTQKNILYSQLLAVASILYANYLLGSFNNGLSAENILYNVKINCLKISSSYYSLQFS